MNGLRQLPHATNTTTDSSDVIKEYYIDKIHQDGFSKTMQNKERMIDFKASTMMKSTISQIL